MKLVLSKNASIEIEESKKYYNLQKESLGDEFKADVFYIDFHLVYFTQ